MAIDSLRDRRILVVEDNALLADALCDSLSAVGACPVGPAASVGDALHCIENGPWLDAAILDADLNGEFSSPVARRLKVLGVPVLLVTGHDARLLPAELRDVPCCRKPDGFAQWSDRLGTLLDCRLSA